MTRAAARRAYRRVRMKLFLAHLVGGLWLSGLALFVWLWLR